MSEYYSVKEPDFKHPYDIDKPPKPLSKPDQKHYQDGSAPCPSCGYMIQPIDITDMFNLDGFEMNVNKYLLRYKYKGEAIKDLKKLVQYSQWMLEREERK